MITQWLVGIASTLAAGYVLKKLPDWLAEEEGALLDRVLKAGAPEDDALVLALVTWAEAKVPHGDAGKAKFKLVADWISSRSPLPLKSEDLEKMIEAAVERMQAEADKRKS